MDTELAYMAGIVDGEGCITITKRTDTRRGSYQLILRLSMYDTEPLYLAAKLFGSRVTYANRKDKKPIAQWVLTGERAGAAFRQLLPYLKVKSIEANIGIRFCYCHSGLRGWHVSDAELAAKHILWEEMQIAIKSHKLH